MDKKNNIPFNKPFMTGKELSYIAEAHSNNVLSGGGAFSQKCQAWIEKKTCTNRALLTHSCTAALEMAAILADIQPGDEVIMPSYTFVSTANAFVMRGGVPVFVDIRSDTLNIDESLIESAITKKTKAIVPVHYAGVACDMDVIMGIAKKHHLLVIEDAAQGVMSSYKGRALGSIGDVGAFSFHETKNVISGEGGALLVNNPELVKRAEIILEKGTDRTRFFRGEVDKYTWQDIGSSYLPSDLIAAFLWAQLEEAENITNKRLSIWRYYNENLEELKKQGLVDLPTIPSGCEHNAHMYYLLLAPDIDRGEVLSALKSAGIGAVFHYVPLHDSVAGKRYARYSVLGKTSSLSSRIIRLPLWIGLDRKKQDHVIDRLSMVLIDMAKKIM